MRVLVCDRDSGTTDLIRRHLERFGHEVLTAHDETEALRCVQTEWTELVILDGTGIGLAPLRALRAVPWTQDVPLIVLSACQEVDLMVEAYEAGADMVLTKPFNPQELLTFARRD